MNFRKACLSLSLLMAGAAICFAGEPLLKSGDKLAFLGDSITQFGANKPSGYACLVISGLDANGFKVAPVYAGISGHHSTEMLARVDRDALSKKPAVMTLSCGVNDVWHGDRGVSLEDYKRNITQLVDKVQAAGVKPVILTATMIGEDPNNANNKKLAAYNDFLRSFAKERNLPLADLNAQMQEAVKDAKSSHATKPNSANYLTVDGVHMAPEGDQVMALGVLRALGLDDEQIAKAKAAWLKIPKAAPLQGSALVSLEDYNNVAALAAKDGLSVKEYMDKKLGETVNQLLESK